MSVSEAVRAVVGESVESTDLAPGTKGFHLEPRCRICRNDQVRTKVNDLLATGASYAMGLRALGDDNAKLEKRDRVTIDSIPRQAYPAAGTSWVPTGKRARCSVVYGDRVACEASRPGSTGFPQAPISLPESECRNAPSSLSTGYGGDGQHGLRAGILVSRAGTAPPACLWRSRASWQLARIVRAVETTNP